MRQSNGTVLPHGLLSTSSGREAAAFNRSYRNTALRQGIVVRRYETDDPQNISKICVEYDVDVVEQDGSLASNIIKYRNLVSTDGMGSIADFFEKKYRVQKKFEKDTLGKTMSGQDGAIVLILCLDGIGEKGVILGGLHHPDREGKLTGTEQQMAGEYNGMRLDINEDGSSSVTFRGATDNDGKPVDPSQGDTIISIEKDGTVQVKHKGITQRLQKDGKYSLTCEDTVDVVAKGSVSIVTDDKFSMTAKNDAEMRMRKLLVEAGGDANMSCAALNIRSDGRSSLKASHINMEASSLVRVRGSSIILEGRVSLGSAGGFPSLLLTTQFLGIGNLGAPVLSTAIGPFSSKVLVSP